MAFLLDTHTLIWAVLDNPDLSVKARKYIINTENKCYFSIVSLWEITIKHAIGALDISSSLNDFFENVTATGFTELSVEKQHLLKLKELPFIHKDPFDRLLISQALYEKLTIITKDSMVKKYDVDTLW